ncbi:DUF6998 domain-containing protein [Mesorhizobium sp. BE184]|uniref:DUF6998 domain-containing protein n=1 Tax=Mesorhizobium sp. BE184 TaxID=2817714 RepID=UPI002863ECAD|nr:hypothetical protein [Mesorhizobium sp. BE184]MDR7035095.1 hypothetical protein [Mesorhizobium sp. BE184]
MQKFKLPPAISDLVFARNKLRDHYSAVGLRFTLDGNLVGDLGEAIAAELFGIRLVETRSIPGIDGYAPDGKTTVQVKATGTGRGPAFRQTETRAAHLLFFDLDFEEAQGTVVFNGPESIATKTLPVKFNNQRMVSPAQIRAADKKVEEHQRLKLFHTEGPKWTNHSFL